MVYNVSAHIGSSRHATTITPDAPSSFCPSTAWIPLDALIEEWGTFSIQVAAFTPDALRAASAALSALAYERDALRLHTRVWHLVQQGEAGALDPVLSLLLCAQDAWADTTLALEVIPHESRLQAGQDDLDRMVMRLLFQSRVQRHRLFALLQEVAQTQVSGPEEGRDDIAQKEDHSDDTF